LQTGTLYVVATPIGNPKDITFRAVEILKMVDRILCEERREGSTLLKQWDIPPKTLMELNEHNEDALAQELILALAQGEDMALISDCGTPAFADPGALLIQFAMEAGIRVVPVPGASSLMTLFSALPQKVDEFYFAGFLPRKEDERRRTLTELRKLRVPLVLMDTPYRLERTLQDIQKIFGKNRIITIGLNLTLPREAILHDTVSAILSKVRGQKAEFILIVH
jgi:16S rRNA (cytidine1402-2'-O)-methyltransferase